MARRFVADHAGGSLVDDALDDCILMVSELVTNAVLYGDPDVSVHVDATSRRVRVTVRDHGPAFAPFSMVKLNTLENHGRGLFLVAALAASWGVSALEGDLGKTVWFTLRSS